MKKICAWCKKDMVSPVDRDETLSHPITHGICGDCLRRMLSFKATSLRSFLDMFAKPVFLVEDDVRVVSGNSAALSLLNKTHEDFEGKLGGEVFDCKYADLPEGCGKTIHCKSCTIRMIVTDSLRTGKNHIEIPAYPDLHHITGEYQIRFLISTERVGDVVLLKIDEVTKEKAV